MYVVAPPVKIANVCAAQFFHQKQIKQIYNCAEVYIVVEQMRFGAHKEATTKLLNKFGLLIEKNDGKSCIGYSKQIVI